MATTGQRRSGNARTGGRRNNRTRPLDNDGIIPVLARAVREVETAAAKGPVTGLSRTKFQVVALLVREERTRIKADGELAEARKAEMLKRLDGIATILATTAARDTSLWSLLAEDAVISEGARSVKNRMLEQAGLEAPKDKPVTRVEDGQEPAADKRVTPRTVIARQLANPFLPPDFRGAPVKANPRRLAGWELIEPLFKSFDAVGNGTAASMQLPAPAPLLLPGRGTLMPHQGELIASAAAGHRTFLLADEPGLGKTAQALLAARAANAFPLLVVVPNVVKTNWAREASIWTPERTSTVIHGNGENMDGFADIIIVNYEVLDRHVGWLGTHGFAGMVVDEAHFIKNKGSQRSQHVLEIANKMRARVMRPLMMALTGTPLINDIEDFRAIWEYLGWIDGTQPVGSLMNCLEASGWTPADPSFYPAARRCVVDMGIVRRRKVDVAADIPARRIADIPVELDDAIGRSIREAERVLAARMVERYRTAIETRRANGSRIIEGIDHDLVRRVAGWERDDVANNTTGENVFSMLRRIGQAKAGLAADYASQLARNVGKVVFFAKHIDVMDAAQEIFDKRGQRYTSIRGDQSAKAREAAIDDFLHDPSVSIIVCSLSAAGVGLNLQVASNVVLAELSWTDAEQTQAIDRVHRIGQELPVTAWRIIAAQTIDTKIAELIDSKAGLAARALDGSDEEVGSSADVQTEALVALLTEALEKSPR